MAVRARAAFDCSKGATNIARVGKRGSSACAFECLSQVSLSRACESSLAPSVQ